MRHFLRGFGNQFSHRAYGGRSPFASQRVQPGPFQVALTSPFRVGTVKFAVIIHQFKNNLSNALAIIRWVRATSFCSAGCVSSFSCASNTSRKKNSGRRNPSIAAMGPGCHGSSGQTKSSTTQPRGPKPGLQFQPALSGHNASPGSLAADRRSAAASAALPPRGSKLNYGGRLAAHYCR